ncbi:MAG: HAD family hydrolase [Gemmatimonadota bacterium]
MRRLLLFDIDGTLVSGGPAKEAFHVALMESFGTTGPIEVHPFAGKTDPQIARELLVQAGIPHEDIDRGMPALYERYLTELERRLPQRPMAVLPGVDALMDALAAVKDVALGLVTGNIAGGARLKLRGAGLDRHFAVGAYGSDAEERNELPALALARARERWGVDFAREDVLVIGDTPRDVECGRAHGLSTVGVATGGYGTRELREAGAHHVLDDLSDTAGVRELLTGEAPPRTPSPTA